MPACFTVLQLRSDSCQIHGYVMVCYVVLLAWYSQWKVCQY